MAITTYNGPPGAGKSYAMISQVLVPGVLAGRRVVTNISGVKSDKVMEYCRAKKPDAELGEVILFEGKQALLPNFFPTEESGDEKTFIKGGDLLIFDEWRLTFRNKGHVGSNDLEPFLRWHRHLVDEAGRATDVIIGTQLITDIHRDFRGLVEGSFKFRKLSALGMKGSFQWDSFDGSTQPKGEGVSKGNGKYKKEIYDLYSSYATEGDGKELKTDARRTIWSPTLFGLIGGCVLMVALAGWGVVRFFAPSDQNRPGQNVPSFAASSQNGMSASYGGTVPVGAIPRPRSPYRIVGRVDADAGVRIVLADDKGSVRIVSPQGFTFDGDRPTYGVLDGQSVVADDRIAIKPASPLVPVMGAM
jgi:zona occludens toxin